MCPLAALVSMCFESFDKLNENFVKQFLIHVMEICVLYFNARSRTHSHISVASDNLSKR